MDKCPVSLQFWLWWLHGACCPEGPPAFLLTDRQGRARCLLGTEAGRALAQWQDWLVTILLNLGTEAMTVAVGAPRSLCRHILCGSVGPPVDRAQPLTLRSRRTVQKTGRHLSAMSSESSWSASPFNDLCPPTLSISGFPEASCTDPQHGCPCTGHRLCSASPSAAPSSSNLMSRGSAHRGAPPAGV